MTQKTNLGFLYRETAFFPHVVLWQSALNTSGTVTQDLSTVFVVIVLVSIVDFLKKKMFIRVSNTWVKTVQTIKCTALDSHVNFPSRNHA